MVGLDEARGGLLRGAVFNGGGRECARAAPVRVAALLMGVWMLSSAAGNYLAGALEKIMSGTGIPPYLFLTESSIGAGVLLLVLTPLLHKLLRSRDMSTVA